MARLGVLLLMTLAGSLRAQVPGDERWDYRFAVAGIPGAQCAAMAMAFDGTNIYLGGSFSSVGRTVASAVARFDGQQFSPLPDGPLYQPPTMGITDLQMYGGKLYACGFFTNVAGIPAGGLGCWDGTSWTVPGVSTGIVYALDVDAQGLLAAGRFALPGWTNPVALARWNGAEWSVLNSELPPCTDPVVCLDALDRIAVVGGNVYGTLSYRLVEDPYAWPGHLLVRCDLSNNWSLVSTPAGDPDGMGYFQLANFGGQLVAAGDFTNAANPALRHIAVFDGSTWHPLGEGLTNAVLGLAASDRAVYVSCKVSGTNPPALYAVLRWDGTNWSQLGTDLFRGDAPYGIFIGPSDTVYAAGLFASVGDVATPGLARWDGQCWTPVLTGAYHGLAGYTSQAASFARHQGRVFMGGAFSAAGQQVTEGVAQWDGSGWQKVGGEANSEGPPVLVRALVSSGSLLFAGGKFSNLGGAPATNVACWDGSAWKALGSGISGNVLALAWWRDSLYAGGRFLSAGGTNATNIARWTGDSWQALGAGCNSNVTTLAVWQDGLYAGGTFTQAGGVAASRIARWDGAVWQPLGSGLGGDRAEVRGIAGNEDGLFVVGRFTSAGGQPITNVARWDGTNWNAVGPTLPGEGYAISVRGRTVFVGIRQPGANGQIIGMVYRWEGGGWTSLGSGVMNPGTGGTLSALLATEEEVFVGGIFSFAGGKPSVGVARWIENPRLRLAIEPQGSGSELRLQATSDPGLRFTVQASEDLQQWTPFGAGKGGAAEWTLPARGTNTHQFFRALVTP